MQSSSYLERNLAALRTTNPRLANVIAELPDVPAVSAKLTTAGEWDLLCQYGDGSTKTYYDVDSPLAYSKDLAARLAFTNPRIIVFLGLGLGLHLLEYARNPHVLNQGIVVIEPLPHVFKQALTLHDLTPLLGNTKAFWFVGADTPSLHHFFGAFFNKWPWLCFANAIEYVPLPPAVALHPQFFAEVQRILPQAIGHQYNRHFGDPYDAFIGTDNTLANLPALLQMPAFAQASGCCRGQPGIVISSGPSLMHALPALREVGSRAVMAACPSALPLLLREKIHPHIWLNIERLAEQGEFLSKLPQKPPHIFVGPPLVHPSCFAGNGGHNTYLRSASGQTEWLPLDGPIVELGHSSSHTAFTLLAMLGCDPIYLVGQDLCYAQDATHASGVWDESARMMKNVRAEGREFEVEGNDGRIVRTNIYWFTYLKTFQEGLFPDYPGRVFNVIPQDMGVKVPGTERIDPDQLSQQLPDTRADPLAILQSCLAPPTPEVITARQHAMAARLLDTVDALTHIARNAGTFALRCKEVQFLQSIIAQRWDLAEPIYKDFTEEVDRYWRRFDLLEQHLAEKPTYFGFLFPLLQGMMLRYNIEYFSSGADITGDFTEITRKTEILHHICKDEAFWATACVPLLAKCLALLSSPEESNMSDYSAFL